MKSANYSAFRAAVCTQSISFILLEQDEGCRERGMGGVKITSDHNLFGNVAMKVKDRALTSEDCKAERNVNILHHLIFRSGNSFELFKKLRVRL